MGALGDSWRATQRGAARAVTWGRSRWSRIALVARAHLGSRSPLAVSHRGPGPAAERPPEPGPGVVVLVAPRSRHRREAETRRVAATLPAGWSVAPTTTDRFAATLTAAAASTVAYLAVVDWRTRPRGDDWLVRLVAPIARGEAVATTPLLVHPERPWWRATPVDGRIRELGRVAVATADGPALEARAASADVAPHHPAVEVLSASPACLALDRAAVQACGPVRDLGSVDATVTVLCVRLGRRGSVVALDDVVVEDDTPVRSAASLRFPLADRRAAWSAVVNEVGPTLRRAATPCPPGVLDVTITVAAPTARIGERWGDWHFGREVRDALRAAGHSAEVHALDTHESTRARSSDVHLVLRGKAAIRRSPGQRHVLWIISHPDEVTTAECDAADVVLVASSRCAERLRSTTRTPVEVLLQATNPERFCPRPPAERYRAPLAVVANSRHVVRPAVAAALEAGLRPAIFGNGWEGLVDPSLVRAGHVPYDELPSLYASVDVVLCDHWDDMRRQGFVANRLFDVLACGTPIISDELPEIADLFGDAVPTYSSPEALREAVERCWEDPEAARRRAEAGRHRVLASHTFRHRATELLGLLERYGLDRPPLAD